MNDEIIFTKEEVLSLLKAFSNIEGFLFSVKDSDCAFEMIEYPIKLLTERLSK
jgi:hypothetical protein